MSSCMAALGEVDLPGTAAAMYGRGLVYLSCVVWCYIIVRVVYTVEVMGTPSKVYR